MRTVATALAFLAAFSVLPGASSGAARPRIALIVDDFGYGFGSVARGFLDLDRPLTISVIPGLRHSGRIAEEAARRGKDVLVHMPMEPIEFPGHDPGPGAIFIEQPETVVRNLVRSGLDGLPGAVGVNNHMGSRALRDSRVMRIVLSEVGSRGLFFLDSKTVAGHTARGLADSLGMVCLENDLFWDTGYDEKEQILEKLDRLADLARLRGEAIGIGHPRAVTLEALKEKLPEFDELGILLVPIADLVRGESPAAPGGSPSDRPVPPAGRTAASDSP